MKELDILEIIQLYILADDDVKTLVRELLVDLTQKHAHQE